MTEGCGGNVDDYTTFMFPRTGLPVVPRNEYGCTQDDNVKHPKHYTQHPSGVECINISRHFNFCMGNAIKYIWRADLKGNDIEDLRKAIQYLEYEIERRQCMKPSGQ